MRIGHGYDVHALREGRALILGGVEVAHTRGLDGHSDADVLLHAIIDSLLGAAALGDIGVHFPPGDEQWRGASSMVMLAKTAQLLRERGFFVVNVDSTIIAQEPRLADFIPRMRENIAHALSVELSAVSVKATTEERLGFTGAEQGIAAHAVCLAAYSRST